jgi:hypothetical protein
VKNRKLTVNSCIVEMGWAMFQNAACTFVKSISADKVPQMMSQFTSQPAVTHLTPNEDIVFSNISTPLIFLVISVGNAALW